MSAPKCSSGAVYSQRRGYPLAHIKVKMILLVVDLQNGVFLKKLGGRLKGDAFLFCQKIDYN